MFEGKKKWRQIYLAIETIEGLILRWLSFIAVRAKLDYAFRYGCAFGTAVCPLLLGKIFNFLHPWLPHSALKTGVSSFNHMIWPVWAL